jgi:hypothetical protein
MPTLKNSRRERFAQLVAQGMPATAAYLSAGYRLNEGNAGRLNRNEHVRLRIQELMADAASKTDISIRRVLEEMARVAFANMADFVRFDDMGQPRIELKGLSRDQLAAVSKVTTTTRVMHGGEKGPDFRVERTTLTLHPKLPALDKIGQHFGLWDAERADILRAEQRKAERPRLNLDALSDEELKILNGLREKLLSPPTPETGSPKTSRR